MIVEFSEPQVLLELPKGTIGEGWELEPMVDPTEVIDQNCRHTSTIALSRVAHLSILYAIYMAHVPKSVYTS